MKYHHQVWKALTQVVILKSLQGPSFLDKKLMRNTLSGILEVVHWYVVPPMSCVSPRWLLTPCDWSVICMHFGEH
jgi:hypothetical protein